MNVNISQSCLIFLLLIVNGIKGERKYTDEELNTWDAPIELKKSFPCYLTGVDYDGQPVYVLEFGKWRIRPIVEKGSEEERKQLDKYAEYIGYQWLKTAREFQNDTRGSYGMIVDMEGYDFTEFANVQTITFTLKSFVIRFAKDFGEDTDWIIGINANYVSERLTELSRPILGSIFSKIDIYGTNKNKWLPKLLRKLPKESLAPWYGGSDDFKPLAVFG